MKMQKIVTTVMIFGALSLNTALASENQVSTQGPVTFTTWDADKNGTIDQQEFNTIREQRQEMVKASGRMGRNMASAPTFAQIDKNSDGQISPEELKAMQQSRFSK